MQGLKTMPVSFPGLFGDWQIDIDPVALNIGNGIYWYGIIIGLGMIAGAIIAMRQAPKVGLTEDHVLDMVLWAVPLCIVGARLYYIIFYYSLFQTAEGGPDFGKMIAIWDGGLAIYGAVIMGVIVVYLFCKRRKIPFGALADVGVIGLLLGQGIGRWGNFVNREAFGAVTTLPWRMQVYITQTEVLEVHPTFFYESMWNLAGVALMVFVVMKGRRFDGETTCFYFLWYGLGRAWIEGLREDSLYLFDWTLMGEPIRVSQALSVVMVAVAAGVLYYNICVRKADPANLFVNRNVEGETTQPLQDQAVEKVVDQVADQEAPAVEAEITEKEQEKGD